MILVIVIGALLLKLWHWRNDPWERYERECEEWRAREKERGASY